MTFRERLTYASAAAVAIAIVLASTVTFLVVRSQLRSSLDASLRRIASSARVKPQPPGFVVKLHPSAFGGATGYAQVLGPGGVKALLHAPTIPASTEARALTSSRGGSLFEDETVSGVHLRVLTTTHRRLPPGFVLQVARPLTEVDDALGRLLRLLGLVSAGGILLAGGLGYVVSRAAARPISALTEAAEHVTATGDLSQRIEPSKASKDDEVGRLAASFNAMLAALEASQESQRRLVADASHELRTPLTSLRTNLDVLASGRELPPEDRSRLLADVRSQIEELTNLVGDLVDAGRGAGDADAAMQDDVRLDELARAAVGRASPRADAKGIRFDCRLEPAVVRAAPERLERAIVNLLDNAVKFSPDGGMVEVVCTASGELTVRDHGPGIADADLPHVFDRFYRSAAARGTPGTGLGLSIVEQLARAHGGSASAANAPEGGAVFRLRLRPAGAPA